MSFTQSGYTFDFISDPTAPNGYDLQCPVGPVAPVSNVPQFVYTFYGLIWNGNDTAPSTGAFDGSLVSASAVTTFQAAVNTWLNAVEGIALHTDPTDYQTAYNALAAALAPYGAPWLQDSISPYGDLVPITPPLYPLDQNQVPAQLAAWQTFITAVFNIAYANDETDTVNTTSIFGTAYETFVAVYGPAESAFDAAITAAQAAYDAAVTAYNAQLAVYDSARSAAIAWRNTYPHIVNGQPAG